MNIDKPQVEFLRENATKHFKECISKKENYFLQEEVNTTLSSLILKLDRISIIFPVENIDHYWIETNLKIYNDQLEEVGRYTYKEDENGISIDDYLVFN